MSLMVGALGEPDPMLLTPYTEDLTSTMFYSNGTNGAAATLSTSASAYYFPVRLSQPRTYVKAWWMNGTAVAATNVDVGIYTRSGTTMTRVVASTAEAQGTLSTMQVAATFTTTTIGPGIYYLAISASTAQFRGWSASAVLARSLGIMTSVTSSPLPSTATATVAGITYVPNFGFSELSTI